MEVARLSIHGPCFGNEPKVDVLFAPSASLVSSEETRGRAFNYSDSVAASRQQPRWNPLFGRDEEQELEVGLRG